MMLQFAAHNFFNFHGIKLRVVGQMKCNGVIELLNVCFCLPSLLHCLGFWIRVAKERPAHIYEYSFMNHKMKII